MQFKSVIIALSAFIVSAWAAENPISEPTTEIIAGEMNTIKWTSTTAGKVTLNLKKGDPNKLDDVLTIAVVEGSSGTFVWTPPPQLGARKDYVIEIKSEKGESNYMGNLTLKNASGAPSTNSTISSTSASATGSGYPTTTTEVHHPTKVYPPMVTGTGSAIYYKPHNVTYGNSTILRKPYTTKSSSDDSSTSTTESESATTATSEPKVSAVPSSPADSSAVSLMSSSLVLGMCVFGAVMYLN